MVKQYHLPGQNLRKPFRYVPSYILKKSHNFVKGAKLQSKCPDTCCLSEIEAIGAHFCKLEDGAYIF